MESFCLSQSMQLSGSNLVHLNRSPSQQTEPLATLSRNLLNKTIEQEDWQSTLPTYSSQKASLPNGSIKATRQIERQSQSFNGWHGHDAIHTKKELTGMIADTLSFFEWYSFHNWARNFGEKEMKREKDRG